MMCSEGFWVVEIKRQNKKNLPKLHQYYSYFGKFNWRNQTQLLENQFYEIN